MSIKIEITVNALVETVWSYWNESEHITKWYSALDSWHTPRAENNLVVGGSFNYRMEAKDGSFGFDFTGIYDEIMPYKKIAYHLADDRRVTILFEAEQKMTTITETFDMEDINTYEQQREGWQSILNHFKSYVEQTV